MQRLPWILLLGALSCGRPVQDEPDATEQPDDTVVDETDSEPLDIPDPPRDTDVPPDTDRPADTAMPGPPPLAWTPLLAAILIFGVAPGLMFDVTNKALIALGIGS